MTAPSDHSLTWLDADTPFPPSQLAWPEETGANGLLAVSRALTPDMLFRAYRQGIYPWSGPEEPVLWWTPNPRMVLQVSDFRWRKSVRQAVRQAQAKGARVQLDTDFAAVMQACAEPRPGQAGTWITPEIRAAYVGLHHQGLAHSVSLHQGGQMLGGLYLVSLGGMVFGESMFSRVPNGSKVCLAVLIAWLAEQGVSWVDCQQQTEHLASLGAAPISRAEFEQGLSLRLVQPQPAWFSGILPWPSSILCPSEQDPTHV